MTDNFPGAPGKGSYIDPEFVEDEIPRVTSMSQVFMPPSSHSRQSVRVHAGMLVTSEQLDEERRRMRRNPHRYIMERRKAARVRPGLDR